MTATNAPSAHEKQSVFVHDSPLFALMYAAFPPVLGLNRPYSPLHHRRSQFQIDGDLHINEIHLIQRQIK